MESLPIEPALLLKGTTALLQQTLGAKAKIVEYTIANRKYDYVVMLAKLSHPSLEVVLKLAGPSASIACPFEQTAALHRLVTSQTAIFMSEILAVDSSYQSWPWRYLIRANVPGVEWAKICDQLTVAELVDLQAQLGDAVAQLHNIPLSAFGEFASDGKVRGEKHYLDALRERAERTIKIQHLRTLLTSVLDQNVDLFGDVREAALCHEDLHRHNLLFCREQDGWQLATILDFDKAWAGCPESDLARLELWDGMTSDSFWAAYLARGVVSSSYERRRPIYQLMWCLKYAKQTEKHLADTNRLCEQLGLPNIEQFE